MRVRGRPSYKTNDGSNRRFSRSPNNNSRPSSLTRLGSSSETEENLSEDSYSENEVLETSENVNLNCSMKYEKLKKIKLNHRHKPDQLDLSTFCGQASMLKTLTQFIIVIILITAASIVTGLFKVETKVNEYKNCSFNELQKKYSIKDKFLWRSLQAGIEGILNNKKSSPAIYLFLYDKKDESKNLIKEIALRACECMEENTSLIQFNPEDFSTKEVTEDYGIIIKKYKEKMKTGSVTIIANLNEIPSRAARALHAICDTYTPIVHNVVVILTLKPVTADESKSNPTAIAEKTLKSRWGNEIGYHELDPLIVRVTDQVFSLEFDKI